MAVNPFWQNAFGQNVINAGVSGPTPGLVADPAPVGNGFFGKFQELNADPVKRDALMAFAGQLLAGGGYSPVKQSGSEIFGRALLASQQARAQAQEQIQKNRYQDAQIAAMERERAAQNPFGAIDPDQFTPESLAEFQATGNYGVLKPRGGLSGVGNFNPGDYTPASFAKFLKSQDPNDLQRYVSPAQPSVQIVNGVPTVVNPSRTGGAPGQAPLTTIDAEAEAAGRLAAEKARATAQGTGAGELDVSKAKKGVAALNVLQTLDLADPLIDAATGSATGKAADAIAGFFGKSMKGAEANAQLKVLQANLMTNMPRMEGPQSDRDVQLYREAAGQIGEPDVPRGIKKAALNMIRSLQQKYADASDTSASGLQFLPNSAPGAQANDAANVQSLLDKYAPRK